jgi:hypothetical protein
MRDKFQSCIDRAGFHVLRPGPHDYMPAEECHEAFIRRSGVMQRRKEERSDIMDPRNCVMLARTQHDGMSKRLVNETRLYLIACYGREEIQRFLTEIDWSDPLEHLVMED